MCLSGAVHPFLRFFVMRSFLDNFIIGRIQLGGVLNALGYRLFLPGLPVGQWDQQVFLGRFLLLLADHSVLLLKPDTQDPPLMF